MGWTIYDSKGRAIIVRGSSVVTHRVPMNVVGEETADDNLIRFIDGVTDRFAASTPVPSDWVVGTDITVNCLLYIGGASGGTAVMRSSISSKSDAETQNNNVEDNINIDNTFPGLSVLQILTRTITASDISAGEQMEWIVERLGGDGGDTLTETLFMRHGPWIEYTASVPGPVDAVVAIHDHTLAGEGGVLTDDEHDGFSEYVEIATPAAPAADKGRLFAGVINTETELFWRRPSGQSAAQVQRISRQFAYDTFDRADSSSIGNLESGQAWSEEVGDWEITGNQLNLVANVTESKAVFPLGQQENFESTVFIGADNGAAANIGIVFRYSDTNNFLLVQLLGNNTGTNGRLRIFKNVGGSLTELVSVEYTTVLSAAAPMTLHVSAHGGIVEAECWRTHNPALIEGHATAIDPSDTWTTTLQGGLEAGVWIHNNQLDDFRAVWYECW